MKSLNQMLATHPDQSSLDPALVEECLKACLECASVCNMCADACLAEPSVASLRRCIRIDLDCADLCDAVAHILGRQTETDPQLLRDAITGMATACRICGAECAEHAEMHAHCRHCADCCNRCESACTRLLKAII